MATLTFSTTGIIQASSKLGAHAVCSIIKFTDTTLLYQVGGPLDVGRINCLAKRENGLRFCRFEVKVRQQLKERTPVSSMSSNLSTTNTCLCGSRRGRNIGTIIWSRIIFDWCTSLRGFCLPETRLDGGT